MKKALLLLTTLSFLVLGYYLSNGLQLTPFTSWDIEALAQNETPGEAVITCDSGDYGLCHIMKIDFYLGGLIPYYYCDWTGKQSDNCPFSVYLLNPLP